MTGSTTPLLALLPLKPFTTAMGRLDAVLNRQQRADLSRAAARRVAAVCTAAGAEVAVVAAAGGPAAAWATSLDLEVIDEPERGGLNGAARAGAEAAAERGVPWCIVHSDLPLLTDGDVAAVRDLLGKGGAVLAPSRDGGTNLLAAREPIVFRYGPGSFARHLAAVAHLQRRVIVTPGTAVELDTPADLRAAAALPDGAWLRLYLS